MGGCRFFLFSTSSASYQQGSRVRGAPQCLLLFFILFRSFLLVLLVFLLKAVGVASKKEFKIGAQADPLQFFRWLMMRIRQSAKKHKKLNCKGKQRDRQRERRFSSFLFLSPREQISWLSSSSFLLSSCCLHSDERKRTGRQKREDEDGMALFEREEGEECKKRRLSG